MPGSDKFDELKREELHLHSTQDDRTARSSELAKAPEPQIIDKRYQLLELIGEGGMGRVYKAKQMMTGRIVALKMLTADSVNDPMHLMRFQQEGKAACAIKHPNAVGVYEFGVTSDFVAYLVMEYVEGPTLADEIADHGPLAESFALQIFEHVADALECAHDNRVLHRDIKPSNIVLVADRKVGRKAMILDFGIAKYEDEANANLHLTKTGEVFGTPLYMSPEQCQGTKTDARSDIYSLGCVMYEAVAGFPPFSGENFLQLVHRQVNDKPPPIDNRLLRKPISTAFQSVIFKCLEKNPANRFKSMSELRAAIENARTSSTVKEGIPNRRITTRTLALVLSFVAIVIVAFAISLNRSAPPKSIPTPVVVAAHQAQMDSPSPADWDTTYATVKTRFDAGQYDSAKLLLDETLKSYEKSNSAELKLAAKQLQVDGESIRNDISQSKPPYNQLNSSGLSRKASGLKFSELLLTEAAPFVASEDEKDNHFSLAQLYAALSEIAGTKWSAKHDYLDKAEKQYKDLTDSTDPYVFHQYGTFLMNRAETFKHENNENLNANQVLTFKNYLRAGIVQLDKSKELYKQAEKSGSMTPTFVVGQIADCTFWIANLHKGLGKYRDADSEYKKAARVWAENGNKDFLKQAEKGEVQNLNAWGMSLKSDGLEKEGDAKLAEGAHLAAVNGVKE
ncbi:MAG TPA: serine/threonine-protein kinase [Planktothrix sp.]|jgi:serine/threonine protein kinase